MLWNLCGIFILIIKIQKDIYGEVGVQVMLEETKQTLILWNKLEQIGTFGTLVPFVPRVPF